MQQSYIGLCANVNLLNTFKVGGKNMDKIITNKISLENFTNNVKEMVMVFSDADSRLRRSSKT